MRPMLCVSAPADLLAVKYPIAAEIKYDGVRAICAVVDGKAKLYSRSGRSLNNFAEVVDKMNTMPEGVYDGEVVSPEGFQALMKRTNADRGKNTEIKIEYKIFDRLNLSEAQNGVSYRPYRIRCIAEGIGERVIMKNPADLEIYYTHVLKSGHEGLILKEIESPYLSGKSFHWMKLKPKDTIDVKIMGLIPSLIVKDHIGYVQCQGEYKGYVLEVDVHSGFTKDVLADMYKNKDKYLGITIELEYQEVTKPNSYGACSLRFPSFKCIRNDK